MENFVKHENSMHNFKWMFITNHDVVLFIIKTILLIINTFRNLVYSCSDNDWNEKATFKFKSVSSTEKSYRKKQVKFGN